ncbi:pectate lyase c [Fusarium acutatum]|uniref:Pectate lyase c n=1 Tax=Fusarium acutatum TaxID=78861 RepID=A0A8H4JG88_9HYPO|nr:pectate lyase c [Fusarium acutatum]
MWKEPFAQLPYTLAYGDNGRPYTCCKGFYFHFTPFENECRTFGRLKDVGREDLAVKVHGYVALSPTDTIAKKLEAARSTMISPYAKLVWFLGMDNGPSMGIVKDWVDEVEYDDEYTYDLYQQVVQVSHFPRMLEGLRELHKHGIVVLDLSARQYVNGTLVDLSMASTVPHPFGPDPGPLGLGKCWQPRWAFQSLAAWDLYCFQQDVIEAWKEDLARFLKAKPGTKGLRKTCRIQAYRLPKETTELRPRGRWRQDEEQQPYLPMLNHRYEKLVMTQAPRHDPLDFAKQTPVVTNVKKRVTGGAKGRGVKKSVAKRKQVKGKMINKPKAPSSRYDLRSHTVKK